MCTRFCSALGVKGDERKMLVSGFTQVGLSTRAIANVLGVSRETVRKEVATSPDNNLSGDAKPPNHPLSQMRQGTPSRPPRG